ncbi:MAG: hypothetical protein H7Z72_21590 [Bacteroidetes bacterium]|nr:hypothetical protein [Fibrella sp.]
MKKHLLVLLTLSALLNCRPGYAQAYAKGPGEPSPTMVASVRTKPVSTRPTTEPTSIKPAAKATKKDKKTPAKAPQNSVSRFWSRIMGICSEVHTAAKKKS